MLADIITACRIVCSAVLLFLPALSPAFYIVYLIGGFTDMIDGTIARKMGTASAFGAKLDSVADFSFILVCLLKILSVVEIPRWLWIWILLIALIKIISVASGFVRWGKFIGEHTILNKAMGFPLFVLPFTLKVIPLQYSGGFLCIIATVAALQEGYYIWTGQEKR